ncbi:hypothetical protein DYB37_012830 [Aphanomyces astaci]|uniref:SET domain-containing protein n=1 Tax=Aphanomyces astaci TaxID=112090 RepID=A0A3R6Y5Q7_APHAT|nr:hypothetical protein AaE_004077 [Aphanomyces astaci]RHY89608.1 hypothetical protein DYB35_012668 [Aphanomyces astaci]RHZ33893.1 hypothetical protein DYB37_012830 [Aphanomyces astaci]
MMVHCLDQGDPDDDADGSVGYCGTTISCDDASAVMKCFYTRHLLFESSQDLRNYSYWGFTDGFPTLCGSERAAVDAGLVHPHIEMRPIDIPGIGTQMGLFATQDLPAGTFLGEYTGVLKADRGGSFDSYGLAYPSTYEHGNLCISASEYGNIMRCINHSYTRPNSAFASALCNGLLRMICVCFCNL